MLSAKVKKTKKTITISNKCLWISNNIDIHLRIQQTIYRRKNKNPSLRTGINHFTAALKKKKSVVFKDSVCNISWGSGMKLGKNTLMILVVKCH